MRHNSRAKPAVSWEVTVAITRRSLMLASAGTLAMPYVARAADTMKIGIVSPLTGAGRRIGHVPARRHPDRAG